MLSRERDDDELSNLSNAAISELRRRSHGEMAPTPGSLSCETDMSMGSMGMMTHWKKQKNSRT